MSKPVSASEVAHDLNNLLTAIIGTADAILARGGLDPETHADIETIHDAARGAAGLVERFRGDDAGAARLVVVNKIIRGASRLLAHHLSRRDSVAADSDPAGAITLTLQPREPSLLVWADPADLERVLLNLIINARHAMPAGGSVTLGSAHRMVPETETRVPDSVPPGDYAVISVADTGAGIPPDALPFIFERGFTSRRGEGGSGLGLASVREIVRGCGGFLTVESQEGAGTRFEIYLPRRTAQRQARRAAVAVPRGELGPPVTGTVLLVEDDPLVRRLAELALHRANWTVLPADSAESARELLKHATCDLLITDIAMPGMDGVTLARLVRAAHPGLPIILTSGYERTATDSPELGFLSKPYGQNDLLAAIARAMGHLPDGPASTT